MQEKNYLPAEFFDEDVAEQFSIEHSIPIYVAKVVIRLSANIENEAEVLEIQSMLVQIYKQRNNDVVL